LFYFDIWYIEGTEYEISRSAAADRSTSQKYGHSGKHGRPCTNFLLIQFDQHAKCGRRFSL